MSSERLIYLPLGGAGEIGMNAYVYGYGKPGKERLILVDLGVTFPDMDGSPGVDLIFPDIQWLAERRDQLEAVFITHAHEDHVGAVAHYYEPLGRTDLCPRVYRQYRAAEDGRTWPSRKGGDHRVSLGLETIEAGPFKVGFVPISHSIPESSGLVIDTPKRAVGAYR